MKSQNGQIKGIFKSNFDHISSCSCCWFPTQILFSRPSYPSTTYTSTFFGRLSLADRSCFTSNACKVTHTVYTVPLPHPLPPGASYCLTDAGSLTSGWDQRGSYLCPGTFCGIRRSRECSHPCLASSSILVPLVPYRFLLRAHPQLIIHQSDSLLSQTVLLENPC